VTALHPTAPLVEMHGVTLQRSGVTILSDIHWRVRAGEAWVILGPNGCGKSTLLRALQGYEWPGEGRIAFEGRVFGDGAPIPAIRRQIGWVGGHLDRDLDGGMTCLDAVCCGAIAALAVHQQWDDRLREQARQLLADGGVAHLADRFYGLISSGERQRVMLARALIAQPVLLLLDEPCAGLDPGAREDFLQSLERVLDRPDHPTVVHVTHHVEEILAHISHALLMKEGRVMECGPVGSVLTAENLTRMYGRTAVLHGDHQSGWGLTLPRTGAGFFESFTGDSGNP
jgi:iron complex transport system ATP-binding protein